ncbi:MAG: hypothetical protein U0237_03000 [Thermoleophilia bacterium]
MRARIVRAGLAALTAATAPAAGLTPAEETLLGRIPAEVRPYCAPDARPPSTSALAALRCDLPTSVGVIVRYSSYPTYTSMIRVYAGVVRLSPQRIVPGGSCSESRLPAERVYTIAGIPAGRWTCFRTASGATTLAWTSPRIATLIWAVRPDGDHAAMLRWWPGRTGSEGHRPGGRDRGRCSPTPSNARCCWTSGRRRHAGMRPASPGGHVGRRAACSTGSRQITYRRYAEGEAAQRDYVLSVAALGITERTGGACDDTQDTERYYGIGPRGRYACTTVDGRARLEWIDFGRAIRGIVTQAGTQSDLLAWWRTQPR